MFHADLYRVLWVPFVMGCSYQKTSIHVILDQIQDLLAWEDSYYGAVIRNTHAGQRVYVGKSGGWFVIQLIQDSIHVICTNYVG